IFTFNIHKTTKKKHHIMFTSYDPNLPDLDFELVNEKQNDYGTEPLIKDFLSSPALAYRMAQPT
ncbi:unnamed protein product, partial [Rotaria magnacalcarata]